jgi:hypothetical protein
MNKLKKIIRRDVKIKKTEDGFFLTPNRESDINIKFLLTTNVKDLGLYDYHIEKDIVTIGDVGLTGETGLTGS